MWSFRSKRRPTEKLRFPEVTFSGEQDGPIERDLKDRLTKLFRSQPGVMAAFLAKTAYGSKTSVALCLRVKMSPDVEPLLVKQVGEVFASIFSRDQHLDIIFLDETSEAKVSASCSPFFSSV